jgi:hypothetical protein
MRKASTRRLAQQLFLTALAAAAYCSPAHALRPFQGTDAAVADPGTFELEAGVARVRSAQQRDLSVPELVGNWGVGHETEIVLEGKLRDERTTAAFDHVTSLGDTALSVKHVWRAGALQEATGISVATECGVLLPEPNASSHTGVTCAAIASERWRGVEFHLNAGLSRTREHSTARDYSLIVEAPEAWTMRPVMEVARSRDTSGESGRSVLGGVIWRTSETMALDVGWRAGHASNTHFNELRAGLTWTLGEAK